MEIRPKHAQGKKGIVAGLALGCALSALGLFSWIGKAERRGDPVREAERVAIPARREPLRFFGEARPAASAAPSPREGLARPEERARAEPAVEGGGARADSDRPREKVLRLFPGDVVAVVDGTSIRAKEIVFFAPGEEDRGAPLSPEMLDFLRDRAIDRLLVTREAERRGIALGPEDEAEIEKLAAQFRYGPEVIAAAAPEEARIAFEREEARGFLLLRALAEREGEPLLPSEEEMSAYLEEHGSGALSPSGNREPGGETVRGLDSEARAVLMAERFARTAEARARLLARLRSESRIEKRALEGA
jgi:hypothetical protein